MDETISAGDVERFVYCPLNWKRAKEGEKGAGGKAGMRAHEEAAESVEAVGTYQRGARLSIETSFLLALVAISGASLAVELVFLEFDSPINWVLVFLSVCWIAGSLYLLIFNLYFRDRAAKLGASARLVTGEVTYADRAGKRPVLLKSKTLPLAGRPDYLVERDGMTIPVEVKTGRTPRVPYDSHVLQVASYCHLVMESTGVRPSHGVVSYPDKQFEIPYTEELEENLLRTLLRIHWAQKSGEAHRDHESKGRCAGCARREGCPERLDVRGPDGQTIRGLRQ